MLIVNRIQQKSLRERRVSVYVFFWAFVESGWTWQVSGSYTKDDKGNAASGSMSRFWADFFGAFLDATRRQKICITWNMSDCLGSNFVMTPAFLHPEKNEKMSSNGLPFKKYELSIL